MRIVAPVSIALVLAFVAASPARAQSQAPANAAASVPRLITVSGTYQPATGQPAPATAVATLAVYAAATDTTPLWQETQDVALDATGRYAVQLGATTPDGVPIGLFAEGQERWVGVQFAGAGDTERRTRLTSVPYALRAADADTLGGRPASAFVLAPTSSDEATTTAKAATTSSSAITNTVETGTPNFLAKYMNPTDLGNSNLMEANGRLGVGTTVPFDFVHVRFLDPTGSITGLAVQNLGSTTASYSGMLFYDQNGILGQFQGFNNVTHEYRINNIAKNGTSQFDGSINFMIGSASRLLVGSGGNIGIGTPAPTAVLEVSNATSGASLANILTTSFTGSTASGSVFLGQKARGTSAAPTAAQNGDSLAIFAGRGLGQTSFGPGLSGMSVRAAENFTDTGQGSFLNFTTTPVGTTAPTVQVTIDPSGNVGVGTPFPGAALEVSRSGSEAAILATSYTSGSGNAPLHLAARGNGTAAAPTAAQLGDFLGAWGGIGYGATQFGSVVGGLGVVAQENFTDTAQGAAAALFATPLGSSSPHVFVAVMPSGNVGIGDWLIPSIGPGATDKLQVLGDIRVGTSGTNGCLMNFAGSGLVGTCASDRRYKKGITPFAPVLDRIAALQPVHFYWRADEFPAHHFGDSQTYGLIAQDVEQVLPQLVVTNADGYKSVDYSALPLLTLQAVKELKAENDDLKKQIGQIDELKQRVSDLERLLKDLQRRPPAQR
jgi:hypothetical protein